MFTCASQLVVYNLFCLLTILYLFDFFNLKFFMYYNYMNDSTNKQKSQLIVSVHLFSLSFLILPCKVLRGEQTLDTDSALIKIFDATETTKKGDNLFQSQACILVETSIKYVNFLENQLKSLRKLPKYPTINLMRIS